MQQMKPWFGPPPETRAPEIPGYRKLRMERMELGKLSLVALVLLPMWVFIFLSLISLLGGRDSFEFTFDLTGLVGGLIGMVLVVIVVTLIHEAVHGLAGLMVGAKPAFGIGPGFAYTTFFQPVDKAAFVLIGASPLVVISIICVAGALLIPSMAGWLAFTAIFNATGAIGDIWMIYRIVRTPRGARFFDLADGFMVYEPVARTGT